MDQSISRSFSKKQYRITEFNLYVCSMKSAPRQSGFNFNCFVMIASLSRALFIAFMQFISSWSSCVLTSIRGKTLNTNCVDTRTSRVVVLLTALKATENACAADILALFAETFLKRDVSTTGTFLYYKKRYGFQSQTAGAYYQQLAKS